MTDLKVDENGDVTFSIKLTIDNVFKRPPWSAPVYPPRLTEYELKRIEREEKERNLRERNQSVKSSRNIEFYKLPIPFPFYDATGQRWMKIDDHVAVKYSTGIGCKWMDDELVTLLPPRTEYSDLQRVNNDTGLKWQSDPIKDLHIMLDGIRTRDVW